MLLPPEHRDLLHDERSSDGSQSFEKAKTKSKSQLNVVGRYSTELRHYQSSRDAPPYQILMWPHLF